MLQRFIDLTSEIIMSHAVCNMKYIVKHKYALIHEIRGELSLLYSCVCQSIYN